MSWFLRRRGVCFKLTNFNILSWRYSLFVLDLVEDLTKLSSYFTKPVIEKKLKEEMRKFDLESTPKMHTCMQECLHMEMFFFQKSASLNTL